MTEADQTADIGQPRGPKPDASDSRLESQSDFSGASPSVVPAPSGQTLTTFAIGSFRGLPVFPSSLAKIQTISAALAPLLTAWTVALPPVVLDAKVPGESGRVLALSKFDRFFANWKRQFRNSWLPNLTKSSQLFARPILPPNMAELADVSLTQIADVAESEGLALFGVPRASITARLLRADSGPKRRRILGDSLADVAADCATALAEVQSEDALPFAKLAARACRAAIDGHIEAAQALATTVLDSAIPRLLSPDVVRTARRQSLQVGDRGPDELVIAEALVVYAIANAHFRYFRSNDGPVPQHYGRHASVHSAHPRQYTKRNASQALLLVGSLILYAERRHQQQR